MPCHDGGVLLTAHLLTELPMEWGRSDAHSLRGRRDGAALGRVFLYVRTPTRAACMRVAAGICAAGLLRWWCTWQRLVGVWARKPTAAHAACVLWVQEDEEGEGEGEELMPPPRSRPAAGSASASADGAGAEAPSTSGQDEGGPVKKAKLGKLGKDPTVSTEFLPDK